VAHLPAFDNRLNLNLDLVKRVEGLVERLYTANKAYCDTNIEILKNENSDFSSLVDNGGLELSIRDRKASIIATLTRMHSELNALLNRSDLSQ
jgi:hypothetical protein